MNIFEKLCNKYDIEYSPKLNRLVVNKPIYASDFILLKNIAKHRKIKEIIVERKVSVYERMF